MIMRRWERLIILVVFTYIGILFLITEKTSVMRTVPQKDDVSIHDDKGKLVDSPVFDLTKAEVKHGPVKIVLLTYMRSGSSFVGDILQHDPDVFYVYEPLRMVQHAVRGYQPILFQNGSWRPGDNFIKIAGVTANDWLACKPENLALAIWDDGFLTSKSNRAKVFSQCYAKKRGSLGIENARAFCVNVVKQVCLSSKSIVTKIIRLPMYSFDPLLEKNPDMKIIHLIRDPRPTLRSQGRFGNYKENELSAYATRYCDRVLRDILTAEDLERKYPGRIWRILYEDLANKPIPMSKELYEFTGLKYTSSVESFVHNITRGKLSKDCKKDKGMCTVRSNSAAQAEEWRDLVSFEFVKTVDSACRPLLYELGLKEIPNLKQLRNKKGFKLSLGKKQFDDFRWS